MPDLCRSCKAPVIWAVTETGKWMPLDATSDPAGQWQLVAGGRAVRATADCPAELYVPHWATCPNADQHRRGRP